MTATMLRYKLEQIEDIIFNGFDYQLPDDVVEKISSLSMQVGSPDYIKTPVFKKRENPIKAPAECSKDCPKKRKNKPTDSANDEDWNSHKTFHATQLVTKNGLDMEFDSIRTIINKMTDKNYTEMRNKIVEVIERVVLTNTDADLSVIGSNIFEIASSNRYYSKIYADLYAYMSSKFEFIKTKYEENFKQFTELFATIEYGDPNENYDKFCEINKINEKRKSLATFYMNLMNIGVISKEEIIAIMNMLITNVTDFISLDNKKNEVDELSEIIAILYNKELYAKEKHILQFITTIANSKVKDYKSLTNKTLFKFMDLIDA